MTIFESLTQLRNDILKGVDQQNLKDLKTFKDYLSKLFLNECNNVKSEFVEQIKANPQRNIFLVYKKYEVAPENTVGLVAFFKQENAQHRKDFIELLTTTLYEGVAVAIEYDVFESVYTIKVAFSIKFPEDVAA